MYIHCFLCDCKCSINNYKTDILFVQFTGAGSLFLLLERAYSEYRVSLSYDENPLSLEAWCSHSAELYPQFKFWLLILQMKLTVLIYIRAIREAVFDLYVDALTQIVPWFFALGHANSLR